MRNRMSVDADILEAWSEGLQVGALVILMLIVICNLRRHVILHKLILLEVTEAGVMQYINGILLTLPIAIFGHVSGSSHLFSRSNLWLAGLILLKYLTRQHTHGYHRYCSSTIFLLYISYFLHNFISWMKIRPFLERSGSLIFLGSLLLVQPYWVVAL